MLRNPLTTGLFEITGICAICIAGFGMARLLPEWLSICLGALFIILVIVSPKLASKHRIVLLRLRLRAFAFWWRVRHMLGGGRPSLSPVNRALHQAVLTGHIHNVTIFLQRGADPNLRVEYDWPLLARAAEAGYHDIAALLLDAGAEMDAVNPSTRYTALIRAAKNGHQETVALLLRHGAALETKNIAGTTALLAASMAGHTEVVAILLRAYEASESVPVQGDMALRVAKFHRFSEIVQMLRDAGLEETGTEKQMLLRSSDAPCAPASKQHASQQ